MATTRAEEDIPLETREFLTDVLRAGIALKAGPYVTVNHVRMVQELASWSESIRVTFNVHIPDDPAGRKIEKTYGATIPRQFPNMPINEDIYRMVCKDIATAITKDAAESLADLLWRED